MKDKIIEVLEFYANIENYHQDIIMGSEIISKVEYDMGEKAKRLLKLLKDN